MGRVDAWFRPKLFGWGATPTTWQGWALIAGYVALLGLDLRGAHSSGAKVVLAAMLTVALVALSWAKTGGAWRWRWGTKDR